MVSPLLIIVTVLPAAASWPAPQIDIFRRVPIFKGVSPWLPVNNNKVQVLINISWCLTAISLKPSEYHCRAEDFRSCFYPLPSHPLVPSPQIAELPVPKA